MNGEMLLAIGLPLVITVVVVVVFVIPALRQLSNATGKIKNGQPAKALVQSISDTGTTISTPSIGADAPVYKFELLVTPPAGGAPYTVTDEQAVPRVFLPLMLPGIEVNVVVDPLDPQHVKMDFQNLSPAVRPGLSAMSAPAGLVAQPVGAAAVGGPAAVLAASGGAGLVAAIESGEVPVERGSAKELLARGTPATATVTTVMPLGTTRQFDPNADPAVADDPVWMFNVQVEMPGQPPFPAAFGHRVPIAMAAHVMPGTKLKVAVDPKDPTQEVAIDWDASPLS